LGEAGAGPIPPVRPPSQWAEAQRELILRYANGATLPSTKVRVRWWTTPEMSMGGWLGVLFYLARRARRGPAGSFVALWRQGTETAEPDLVFRPDPRELPSLDGCARGTVHGEYAPNGALLLDIGSRIRPTYNPQQPYGDLTRGLRPYGD